MLWKQDTLKYILHPKFFTAVLVGGIALVVLAAARAIALWVTLGHHHHVHEHDFDDPEAVNHDHAHCEGHDCGHDHAHDHHQHPHDHDHAHTHHHDHSHDHDHGHDHGWNPWRYIILMLPVVLFFLDLPNQGFSAEAMARNSNNEIDSSGVSFAKANGDQQVLNLEFKELERSSYTPMGRKYYDGKKGRLKGQLVPTANDKRFSLVRVKITCCAADAVPLNVVIMIDPKAPEGIKGIQPMQWIEVTGTIQFVPRKDRPDEFATVLLVESPADVKPAAPDSNPYLQ